MRVRIEIVIPVWRHGREAVPTVRSLLESAEAASAVAQTSLVLAVAQSCADGLPAVVRSHARVVLIGDSDAAVLAGRGLSQSTADVVGVVEAGDLVGVDWLSAAARVARGEVIRPEFIVTFGQRTGIGRQPTSHGIDQVSRLLAHVDVWASIFAARADTVRQAVAAGDLRGGSLALAAAFAEEGIAVRTPIGSVGFIRRWGSDHPFWRAGPVLERVPLLTDKRLATDPPPLPVRALRPARILRVAGRLVKPWRDALSSFMRRSRPRPVPTSVLAEWATLNSIEPLLPYPRKDTGAWIERWGPPTPQIVRESSAYLRIIDALPSSIDYLYFAPWLRTGGGDSVLIEYLSSVKRQDPQASVVLLTTEPVISTRLDQVPAGVSTVELAPLLARGVPRDAFVEWIVPQLIAQYQPHTVHAFNSTVGFDVIERHGPRLSQHSNLFLTSFAIDRSEDGEALSVMFLRTPGFLDPVSKVLVDSQSYATRLVHEHGYAPEKFLVQRSVVSSARRSASAPRDEAADVLRVFWAGRFDLPKRLDIYAALAARAAERNMPIEFHFYGQEVMGSSGLSESLAVLDAAGAVRHPPYASFAELPLEVFGAYVLTSEWEGIPLTVLEAMCEGIPVVGPLVGGVGEVLSDLTGYPIGRFDDIEAYLDALLAIRNNPRDARGRAEFAKARVSEEFSVGAFDARLTTLVGYFRAVQGSEADASAASSLS